jgi:hypothetical protein
MHIAKTRFDGNGRGNCETPGLKQEHRADLHSSATRKISDEADMIAQLICSRLFSGLVECDFTPFVVRGRKGGIF